MISRQPLVGIDPLKAGCKSPASICSDSEVKDTAASFVFVEETRQLRKHPTAIHTTPPDEVDLLLSELLPGEEKQAIIHNVSMGHPVKLEGVLMVITNLRVILNTTPWIEIPLASILDVKPPLDIKTKDSRFFQIFSVDKALVKLLHSLVFAIAPSDLFPLHRKLKSLSCSSPSIYDIEVERARFDVCEAISVSDWNFDFSVCATYPRKFLVPSASTKDMLLGSSRFRDKARVPILCWAAKTTGTIWRSSQPKSSLLNRSADDEEYIKLTNVMLIIDCRPMLNAYANIANGAGVESLGNYHKGIELWFAGIQNIHHVRDAWEKMFLLAQQYYSGSSEQQQFHWLSGLETSGWLDLMVSVLRAASMLTEKISEGVSVLCRCSHGLDRTPQVVSLAMLALDPYYRTISGFAILIEKEWIAMGHRFHSRYCIGQAPHDDVSPIFSQWIECVYQLVSQNPDEFEFTPEYLVVILSGAISGRFGNFLFDSEKERIEKGSLSISSEVEDSMWPVIWSKRDLYLNHNFERRNTGRKLTIDHRLASLRIFPDVWLSHRRI